MRRETFLSGDIGGTNTRFMLYEVEVTEEILQMSLKSSHVIPGELILNKKYQNQEFDSFISVLKQFLEDAGSSKPPITACFACAGPVKNNVVRFTNRDSWHIDGELIAEELGIDSVRLINDFLAVGYGILTLDETTECLVLQGGTKDPTAPIACIGAGTGLGQCFLTPDSIGGIYQCFPSEGGHAEFSPRNDLEVGLMDFLKTKFHHKNRVSVERVVSGTGLVNIYEYLSLKFPELVSPEIHDMIANAGDLKGAVIAKNQDNAVCKKTMEIFITAYGAEAGVAALKWLPYGGLYLTGGLTPKNIDLMKDPNGPFMTALLDKGRVSGMLCSVPIYAVLVENLGERGAHYMSFKMLQDIEKKLPPPAPVSKKTISPVPTALPMESPAVSLSTMILLSTLLSGGGFLLGYMLSKRK
eukprot:CAMPEP_0170067782 /NCGR_PEP_ID=MMETSP0019_2-20121128/6991_1 /TAXON_ID=98059 /ORGANISM="Dinobryon sp., Strain UTEXLB2267" /LENGTH=412 /DNA_ID=CAMNT_0010275239 /DNA_START=36 /DNA_END=1274 /DNA_ORIENTATION=-